MLRERNDPAAAAGPAGETILTVQGVTRQHGRRAVVDNVGFQAASGEIVLILGSKGAGKQTLLQLIAGELPADSGSVTFRGQDVARLDADRRWKLGMGSLIDPSCFPPGRSLLQRILGFPARSSIGELVEHFVRRSGTLSRARCREQCDEVLSQFGLSQARNRRLTMLSGGERCRARLAMCLAANPEILLLDQVFKGIDPVTGDSLQSIFRTLADRGLCILHTDYRPSAMASADRVLLMHEGKLIASGAPKEVVQQREAFQQYLRSVESSYGKDLTTPAWRWLREMPGGVFLSYRRADNPFAVGAIRDELVAHFGVDAVFLDVDSISLGERFPEALTDALSKSLAVLAVIGEKWLDVRREDGRRRLDDPADFVRLEIERALEQGIPVIPVLVGGAKMPMEAELPDSLRPMVQRQAIEIPPLDKFKPAIGHLIDRLQQLQALRA